MVGGAHGDGRVYEKGKYVGDTTITQLSVGFQAGGQAYSEIIFFQDKAAFDRFTAGNFEMSATAQAVAITAGASATAGYDRCQRHRKREPRMTLQLPTAATTMEWRYLRSRKAG